MQKQFFSDISHELKTPMSAIIGSVEILQKEGIKNKDTFNEFMGILLKEYYWRYFRIISIRTASSDSKSCTGRY